MALVILRPTDTTQGRNRAETRSDKQSIASVVSTDHRRRIFDPLVVPLNHSRAKNLVTIGQFETPKV